MISGLKAHMFGVDSLWLARPFTSSDVHTKAQYLQRRPRLETVRACTALTYTAESSSTLMQQACVVKQTSRLQNKFQQDPNGVAVCYIEAREAAEVTHILAEALTRVACHVSHKLLGRWELTRTISFIGMIRTLISSITSQSGLNTLAVSTPKLLRATLRWQRQQERERGTSNTTRYFTVISV